MEVSNKASKCNKYVNSKSTDEVCIFKGKHKIKIISTRQLQNPLMLTQPEIQKGHGKRGARLIGTDLGALKLERTVTRHFSAVCAMLLTRTPGQGLGQTVLLPLSQAKAARGSQNHPKSFKQDREATGLLPKSHLQTLETKEIGCLAGAMLVTQ